MYIFLGLIGLWVTVSLTRGYFKAKDRKSYLTKNFLILGLVILLLFLFGPFFIISPIKLGYSSLKSNGVTLYYPSSHLQKAKEILEMSNEAARANSNFYRTTTQTKILMAVSDLDMLRFGVYPRANGGGMILGIIVRESRATQNIIAHEMSHRNLAGLSRVSSSLFYPRWFDEGLASYLGKMDYYKKTAELKDDLQKGLYLRDITNWKGITGGLRWLNFVFFKHNSKLIYGQSYLMVKYLFDTYGQEKVYQLVQRSRETSFDKAFLQTFGISVSEFHQNFINYLNSS